MAASTQGIETKLPQKLIFDLIQSVQDHAHAYILQYEDLDE